MLRSTMTEGAFTHQIDSDHVLHPCRYIPRRTSGSPACQLVKSPLIFDAAGIPSGFAPYTSYLLNGSCPTSLEFGDIAVDPRTNTLYGAMATPLGQFFTINLNTLQPPPATNPWNTVLPAGTNPSLQIAFSCDYSGK